MGRDARDLLKSALIPQKWESGDQAGNADSSFRWNDRSFKLSTLKHWMHHEVMHSGRRKM
jgi:hypothetical protein